MRHSCELSLPYLQGAAKTAMTAAAVAAIQGAPDAVQLAHEALALVEAERAIQGAAAASRANSE